MPRKRRAESRGRHRRDKSVEKKTVVYVHHKEVRSELRRRFVEKRYKDGRTFTRALVRPTRSPRFGPHSALWGVVTRALYGDGTNIESVLRHALFAPSPFNFHEIREKRFCSRMMNDNYSAWEEYERLRRVIASRRKGEREKGRKGEWGT